MNENNYNNEVDGSINIVSIFQKYLAHWKLVLALMSIVLLVGVFCIFLSPKKYLSYTTVLLIEEKSKGKGAGAIELDLGLLSTTNNIDNEITLFKSPDLMLGVVKELDLHYVYSIKNKLREIDIYKHSPYRVKLENDSILHNTSLNFSISKEGAGFNVSGFYTQGGQKSEFIEKLNSLPASFPILGTKLNIELDSLEPNGVLDEVYIKISNPLSIADHYSRILDVSTETKYSSALVFNIKTSHPQKGKDILTQLIKAYNLDNQIDKNKEALSTAHFISERIQSIAVELGDVERDVEKYKQNQGITNLSGEAQLYMGQTALNTEKQIEIETQLRIVNMISEFIRQPENKEKVIPNIGLTDPGLVSAITDYNARLLNYTSISSSLGQENPVKIRALAELEIARGGILSLVDEVVKSIRITKQNIDNQLSLNATKIYSLPMQERGLLEKMRQQQTKENLYLFLLQKREEANITMAAVSDKAKVIVNPRSTVSAVSPNKTIILLISIIIGFVVSSLVIYILVLLKNKIENREELEAATLVPILGVITKNEEDKSIVMSKNSVTPIAELFRYLRNRIEFVLESHPHKSILVTSTVSGEGKTFISINLACAFALNDKKVLLVGMDVRNPQLAGVVGFSKGPGLTDYIVGSKENWRDLLVSPLTENPNLDILQAGTIPPNPNELLKSSKIQQFFEEAKNEYDLIIMDTAPIGIISDTYELSHLATLTLYVTRENVTYKSAIPFINDQFKEKRFANMFLVLNDADLSSTRSYRYGYTGTYGYNKK